MRRPYWIPRNSSPYAFPPIERALTHPDGLLAIGGDLSPERLMIAYRKGIFPWYSDDQPILWWSPSQRMVLFPEHLQISRSLRKTLNKHKFTITLDQNFPQVLKSCAAPRRQQEGTWITDEMYEAYYSRGGESKIVTEIYSVRQTARQCGRISISQHFSEWVKAGQTLGNLVEVRVFVEVGGGTGSIDFTTARVELH